MAVVAGASSSCSATLSSSQPLNGSGLHCPRATVSTPFLRSSFRGLSLQEDRTDRSDITTPEARHGLFKFRVNARAGGSGKTFEVEVDKPLGLTLGQKSGGGVVVTAVQGGGNAAKAGLKSGDQVIYTSSFFGDELWPADKLGFTNTAIQAKPDSVYFVVSRGASVDVKRLPKRPAPPRFGRKLTENQKARATHICLDCGYIYALAKSFDEQAEGYSCPQCQAPKKRFARYDVNSGKAIGGGLPVGVIVGLVAGVGAAIALVSFGLQ